MTMSSSSSSTNNRTAHNNSSASDDVDQTGAAAVPASNGSSQQQAAGSLTAAGGQAAGPLPAAGGQAAVETVAMAAATTREADDSSNIPSSRSPALAAAAAAAGDDLAENQQRRRAAEGDGTTRRQDQEEYDEDFSESGDSSSSSSSSSRSNAAQQQRQQRTPPAAVEGEEHTPLNVARSWFQAIETARQLIDRDLSRAVAAVRVLGRHPGNGAIAADRFQYVVEEDNSRVVILLDGEEIGWVTQERGLDGIHIEGLHAEPSTAGGTEGEAVTGGTEASGSSGPASGGGGGRARSKRKAKAPNKRPLKLRVPNNIRKEVRLALFRSFFNRAEHELANFSLDAEVQAYPSKQEILADESLKAKFEKALDYVTTEIRLEYDYYDVRRLTREDLEDAAFEVIKNQRREVSRMKNNRKKKPKLTLQGEGFLTLEELAAAEIRPPIKPTAHKQINDSLLTCAKHRKLR